jgi:FkbM family methyltransferase
MGLSADTDLPEVRIPTLRRPRSWYEWRLRRRFLRQFVRRGDLVFDIGANVGEYTVTFLELGARAVAVEPNPDLAQILRRRLPDVPVEAVAVSDREGTAVLQVGERHREATIALPYAELLRDRGQNLRAIEVPVTTLDSLAAKYSPPDFVKIDVEGNEAHVLRGMTTFAPPALSFEYHPSLLDAARECLEMLAASGYGFRATIGSRYAWETAVTGAGEIVELIGRVAERNPDMYGDVYAIRGG